MFEAMEAKMDHTKPFLGSMTMTIADIVYYIEINTCLQLTSRSLPEECPKLQHWYKDTMDHPVLKELTKQFDETVATHSS